MLITAGVVQMTILFQQPIMPLYVAELQGSMDRIVLVTGILFSAVGLSGVFASPVWGIAGQKWGYFPRYQRSADKFNGTRGSRPNFWSFVCCPANRQRHRADCRRCTRHVARTQIRHFLLGHLALADADLALSQTPES